MHDSGGMSFCQTFGDVLQNAQQFRELFTFIVNLLAKSLAVYVLHGDEVKTVDLADLINVLDVRVV